jgi:hypothetical protein
MGSMTKTYKPKNKNIVKLKKYINGFRKDIRNNVLGICWGFVSSTWGSIYQAIAQTLNRVTAENGDFLIAENGDNIIIEE